MPPEIFTGTPIEAHIVAVFMKAQMAVAGFMGATPVFRALLFGVLGWTMVLSFLRAAAHRHNAGTVLIHVLYRVAMVFLALALLGRQVSNVNWRSARGAWAGRTGITSDVRYRETLNSTTPGLSWYLRIYGSLSGAAQAMVNATASAFNDDTLRRDPTFVVRQLARMSAMALGPDITRQLDDLVQTCGDTSTGKVVEIGTSLREQLDFTRHPECQDMWTDFQQGAREEADRLIEKYPTAIRLQVAADLARQFPNVATDDFIRNSALAAAIAKSAQDRAGFRGDMNQSANTVATFSDESVVDKVVEDSAGGVLSGIGMNVVDWASSLWRGNARATAMKGDMANRFNEYAALIPVARGFLQGILALLFVVVAYTVGFGTWRPMYAWLLAEGTLCLYKPVAVLAFKVANYFWMEQKTAAAISKLASGDGLIVGGARLMDAQIQRIQTVYLAVEIGAFMVFALGAIACFRPLSQASNAAGAAILGGAAGAVVQAGSMFAGGGAGGAAGAAGGGAAGGGATAVNVNIMRTSGAAAGEGATPAAPGIITPSPEPPQTWDKVA